MAAFDSRRMQAADLRFTAAWGLPVVIGAALLQSPYLAWAVALGLVSGIAVLEAWLPGLRRSPPPTLPRPWFVSCVRLQVPLQAALLAVGVAVSVRADSLWAVLAAGIAVGQTTGGQGITFAHELGHSKSRADRLLAWLLMGSVLYAHFMVEHYRGHHPRAATFDDPASARRGESLWRFLPRTLAGSLASAWRLEAGRLRQHRRGWASSPLAWATAAQVAGLAALGGLLGAQALLFWVVQSLHAIWLLETINYIEHYGLERRVVAGRREAFAVQHAWGADHRLSNSLLANLQRHADHHLHAWKPYASLEALPGPQLPTGYAGCIYLACVPRLWFGLMHPRLARVAGASP